MIVQGTGVNDHGIPLEVEGKAIQAPGGRAVQVFTIDVIVRSVARAFETITVIAEWHGTTEMDATMMSN